MTNSVVIQNLYDVKMQIIIIKESDTYSSSIFANAV